MNQQRNNEGALSGYRVLDLADERGIFCSRILADMGADVVRVERPGEGSARGLYFWAANLGKRGITLNLAASQGREIFKRLVKSTDILVESYQSAYLETLGLDYSWLSEVNPRLIMASITNFGQSGPCRNCKSSDLVASALGGQMYVCGEPDTPPLKPFGSQSYFSACLFAAIGIMTALWGRHLTGKGQQIDISIQDCVAACLDHVLVRYFYEGVVTKRQDSLYWNNAFRVFPCRDGYILLSMFHQWGTLVEWLDSEGMAEDLTDKKWLDRDYRLQQLAHVIEVLERWARSHTVAELVEQGQLMRFPWAEVVTMSRLLDNSQLRERDFWVEVEHPETCKRSKFPGAPCKLSRSPWQVGSHMPSVGEHNMDIYCWELGLSEREVEALVKEGII
ncbi:CaiB/BaiF CoA transferase family protein [Chloroflexota bacterium]